MDPYQIGVFFNRSDVCSRVELGEDDGVERSDDGVDGIVVEDVGHVRVLEEEDRFVDVEADPSHEVSVYVTD